jgi:hypothetical protein
VQRLTARIAVQFDRFVPLFKQTIHQAWRRVLVGQPVASRENVHNLVEPRTHVVQQGKTKATVDFGRQFVSEEVGGGIVIASEGVAAQPLETRDLTDGLPILLQHDDVLIARPMRECAPTPRGSSRSRDKDPRFARALSRWTGSSHPLD